MPTMTATEHLRTRAYNIRTRFHHGCWQKSSLGS